MFKYNDLAADQLECIEFMCSGEDSLICADVGTGKTVISLTAAKQMLEDGDVKRWLVLAPLLVATDVWSSECAEWEHLKDLKVSIACGTEGECIKAIQFSSARIVVINYENLPWLMNYYPKARKGNPETLPFDGLICDEIDKLKSVGSQRFKNFRNRIGVFKRRIGLTGTFIPNKLEEIWGQAFVIDGGQSFGRSYWKWLRKNFYPTDYNQHNWAPFPNARQHIVSTLADLVYRLVGVGLPEVIIETPTVLELPPDVRKLYAELEKEFYLMLDDGGEVNAVNSGVLVGKLQQISAGFSYTGQQAKTRNTVWHTKVRFDWLDKLYFDLCSQDQLLVFYHFNAELEELQRRFPGIHHLGKGVTNTQARANIKAWNDGGINLLALHPASAGHGLNLQKSGAHHIAFLTMPWSGGMFKQVVGRLARRGQVADKIYVHSAVFADTIDEDVFEVVTGRLEDMENFLNELGNRSKR